jgi:hypothetical protein
MKAADLMQTVTGKSPPKHGFKMEVSNIPAETTRAWLAGMAAQKILYSR